MELLALLETHAGELSALGAAGLVGIFYCFTASSGLRLDDFEGNVGKALESMVVGHKHLAA